MKDKTFNIPHNECGECIISLAWDDMTQTEKAQLFNMECSRCQCYLYSIGVSNLETCAGCGRYTADGHLCSECRKKISW